MLTEPTSFTEALAELRDLRDRIDRLAVSLPLTPEFLADEIEPPLFVNVPGPALTDEQIERLLAQDAA